MSTITVSPQLLETAALRNNFSLPADGLIFFGIRGAIPENAKSIDFAAQHVAAFAQIDFRRMRCTLGQWDRKAGLIALFQGSTIPSITSVAAAKKKGGAGANMLIPGRYEHQKGVHKAGKPGAHRAFRQARFFPVLRTANDLTYDNFDRLDLGGSASDFVWDNLHSSYHADPESGYSSAGCQVVCGLPERSGAAETGPWRRFVDNAYANPRYSAQQRFPYLLFTAKELAVASGDPAVTPQLIRFGSTGPLARKVQEALRTSGDFQATPDGDFGRVSLKALTDYQRKKFGQGAADGVCGPDTGVSLGLKWPALKAAAAPPNAPEPEQPSSDGPDIPDETDLSEAEKQDLPAPPGTTPMPPQPPKPDQVPAAFDFGGFFTACGKSLFGSSLSEPQKTGMRDVIEYWLAHHAGQDPRWLTYILATIFHETGAKMIPVREGFAKTDEGARAAVRNLWLKGRIKKDYAKPENGISYFGRGRVQTTFKANYQKLSNRFHRDFVNSPGLLLDSKIDAEVAVAGHIEGIWTKLKLSDYINATRCDYAGARHIVNGKDKNIKIAGYAGKFEPLVRAALGQAG